MGGLEYFRRQESEMNVGGKRERREGKNEGTHTRATSAYVGCEWNRDESKTLNLIGLHKAEERQRRGRKKKDKDKNKNREQREGV